MVSMSGMKSGSCSNATKNRRPQQAPRHMAGKGQCSSWGGPSGQDAITPLVLHLTDTTKRLQSRTFPLHRAVHPDGCTALSLGPFHHIRSTCGSRQRFSHESKRVSTVGNPCGHQHPLSQFFFGVFLHPATRWFST
jgi:hypothetical protein